MSNPDHTPPNAGLPDTGAPTAPDSGDPAPRLSWIPIRSLSDRHRERVLAHMVQLTEADRYLRFGYLASDAQIARYVDQLDFERDEVFGVFDRRLRLIAMAHLAYAPEGSSHQADAEFGVSVLPHARGRAYGTRLFEHAVLHARNHGIQTLFVHALSENTAMLRIARSHGATVERAGSESEAHLKLPPETLASHVEQLVGDGVAELDYRFKQQAKRANGLLELLAEIKDSVTKSGSTASQ
ncbi:putative acetyltransferase [Burkholderiales bacterium JOSHI_001]|nr:putative acetyltransferase [Burkholderiales bacterium JOSHI_001]